MKRRDFIRNIAVSGGVLLLPLPLMSFSVDYKPHIVIIGDNDIAYIERFCLQNSFTRITSIGWDQEQIKDFNASSIRNVAFDFSLIAVNHRHPTDNSVWILQEIKDIFKPNNSYLLLCSLHKREALLSKGIIDWLGKQQVNYWFFGTIPLLNPRIVPWVSGVFSEFDNNSKVMIYDINKLQSEYGTLSLSDAFAKCNERLVGELNNFYTNLVIQ